MSTRGMWAGLERAAVVGRAMSATALLGVAVVAFGSAAAARAASGHTAPKSGGRWVTRTYPYTVGQAADWLDNAHVIYHANTPDGQTQIFRSTLRGGQRTCLTCGLSGRNQVPVVQPHGNWVLFHSWHGHRVTVGSPGFGGLGSDVWVMTRDGRRRTNLTKSTELHDNFHAYWSPNGKYIVWSALNWNAAERGNGKSDIRVARFDPNGPQGPRLTDEHAVRPGNGHWYETQWWAPDGSGFLYTESVDTSLNTELFFCRLPNPARGSCRPHRLTHNPAWDEQAIFTPDMQRIIFMSTRDHAGAFNNWSELATLLDLPASYDYALILPVFNETFLQPAFEQANDLYEITLRWNRRHMSVRQRGPVRRLTHLGGAGWIIPEFAWDPAGRRLLWTQNKLRGRVDEPTVLRQIRLEIINRLAHVEQIADVPFDIVTQVRDRVGKVLQDPSSFAPGGSGANGSGQPTLASQTRIGEYAPPHPHPWR
jgi:hypothetical protein